MPHKVFGGHIVEPVLTEDRGAVHQYVGRSAEPLRDLGDQFLRTFGIGEVGRETIPFRAVLVERQGESGIQPSVVAAVNRERIARAGEPGGDPLSFGPVGYVPIALLKPRA